MDKILFFDGYCSLCNGFVDLLVRLDKKSVLKFASLQGATAKEKNLSPAEGADPDTVIYFRDGAVFERSTAVLLILRDLGGLWVLTSVFFLVPRVLRDLIYRLVAKTRYQVFGKRDTCRMPTPEERQRLLP